LERQEYQKKSLPEALGEKLMPHLKKVGAIMSTPPDLKDDVFIAATKLRN
jgi:hypothetical protein